MKSTNDGRRKSRVEKEVQQVVSNYIIHHLRQDLPGLVTVTRVQMPADFRAAQVFLTYYDVTNENEKINIAEFLNDWSKDIQDEIASQLKMRYCPKVTFFNDEAIGNILKIEKILSTLAPEEKVVADDEDAD